MFKRRGYILKGKGRFWEGSHLYLEKCGYIFWEGGLDSGSVSYICFKGKSIF